MINFSAITDEIVIKFIADNFDEFSCNVPEPDLWPKILHDLKRNKISIVKQSDAFAVVSHANRSPLVPPESCLLFLYVVDVAQGRGIGTAFLNVVKKKYILTEGMTLVCEGEGRKNFFSKCGFEVVNFDGREKCFVMRCDPTCVALCAP